jgi:NAD(P)-dependent dehydrogenase (short-subunit alcohol dehydrogenase family)
LPLLLQTASDTSAKYPPTLIFTGATASVKASAQMSAFASSKFALRALSTSIAKEFAPRGVHVAHAIIDGVIDTPMTKEWLKDAPPEGKVAADDIAETYWNLHTQGRRCFTNEIDIRPMLEEW